ncbi:ABC transporter substrate-binding protein [Sphingobacterium tabacisoli]|uniref:ABC transporter substrate-binding protein n=1 Tax=Sphingobacterium tabacisoli TaxID=2044855 RepID=A0ABW5L5N1_9SPHI|nr:ABC transporter substrate-binding protein [Sphingobacterium tabacisoli]
MKIKQKGNVLRIGVLLPSNTSYPIGRAFLKGLKEELVHIATEYAVELIKKFTKDRIEEALVKCFEFEEVDLVVGLISAAEMEEIDRIVAKYQKPVVACHLGEHIPKKLTTLQYVVPLSLDIWKDVYALGYYASQHFGSTAVLCESFYEAGFGFGALFDLGMKAFNPESQLYFRIVPHGRAMEEAAYTDLLADLTVEQVDFVVALFHGQEAALFASAYRHADVSELPLVGLPFFRESSGIGQDQTTDTSAMSAFFSVELLGQSTVTGLYEAFGRLLADRIQGMLHEETEQVEEVENFTSILSCVQWNGQADMETFKFAIATTGVKSLDDLIVEGFENQISTGWSNSYLAN